MKIKDYFYSQEEFTLEKISEGILQTQNIPSDISNYYNSENYISHTNKKQGLKDLLYSKIQRINLKNKLKLIQKYSNKKTILDYGCGNGIFLEFMKSNGYSIQGFEPSNLGKKETEKRLESTLIDNINEIKNTDIITLWHVLEHIENPDEILEKLKSKLNPNGIILIALPNYKSYDAKYYKEFWAAWDVPRHIFHYSKDGAVNYFSKKFKLIDISPLLFDSFYVSLLSENYKKNPLAFLKAFYIGLKSNLKAKKDKNYSSLVYILKNKE
ncbi:MAG: class I SAM-dependent methyltransferase [Flavobacteriales bacterium]|nr:class I SAM-dependent methyltransferase [Flavobacteriales bacterium]